MRAEAAERLSRWLPILIAALVVRLAYWIVVIPDWVPMSDADQYVQLSRNLADGLGFALQYPEMEVHPTAFRPPLYPFLLAPGAWLFDAALWPARLLQAFIGSLVAVLAGVAAARIGGRTAGLAAGIVVAVYPPLVANDTVTLTEPLALVLLLGAVLLLDEGRWIGAGTCGGLLLLTRPNGYLVIGILLVWAWRRLGWRRASAMGAVAALILLPWLVRNKVQVDTWRPTTSDGLTMAAVYGEPAQRAGTFIDPAWSPEYDDPAHRLAQFDEAAWSGLLMEEAIEAMRRNPGHIAYVVDRNFRGFFELDPELNDWPELNDGRSLRFREMVLPAYWVVTVVGLVGLWRHRRDPRVLVLAALVGQFVVLSLLLVAPPRLRAPFDLFCCIGAGLAWAWLQRWWTTSRSAGSAPASSVVSPGTTDADVTAVTTQRERGPTP